MAFFKRGQAVPTRPTDDPHAHLASEIEAVGWLMNGPYREWCALNGTKIAASREEGLALFREAHQTGEILRLAEDLGKFGKTEERAQRINQFFKRVLGC